MDPKEREGGGHFVRCFILLVRWYGVKRTGTGTVRYSTVRLFRTAVPYGTGIPVPYGTVPYRTMLFEIGRETFLSK